MTIRMKLATALLAGAAFLPLPALAQEAEATAPDGPAVEQAAPEAPADADTAFVTDLYQKYLKRDPDPEGLATYVGFLKSRKKSRRDIAKAILTSDEFKATRAAGAAAPPAAPGATGTPAVAPPAAGGSDAEYVKQLYKQYLKREPDAAGLADYVGQLQKGEKRATILKAIAGSDEAKINQRLAAGPINSPAHASNQVYVRELYKSVLGRTPKDAEIAHWVAGLDAGIYTPRKLGEIVRNSDEAKKKAGGKTGSLDGVLTGDPSDGTGAKEPPATGRLNDDLLKGYDEQPLKKLTWDVMWAALQKDIAENPDKYNEAKDGLSGKDPAGGWGPPIDAAYARLAGYLKAAGTIGAQSVSSWGQRSDCIFVNRPGTPYYEEIHLFEYGGGRFATGRNGIKGVYKLEEPAGTGPDPK